MYALFTEYDKFNFKATYGIIDFLDDIKGLSYHAKFVYCLLLKELRTLRFSNRLKEDDTGLYVEKSRKLIGEALGGMCRQTAAKYVKELESFGLLQEKPVGYKQCNKIYLKYNTNKKYRLKDESTIKKEKGSLIRRLLGKTESYKIREKSEIEQKNNDAQPVRSTSSNNLLVNKANDIIAQIKGFRLVGNDYKEIGGLLFLCNNDLAEFKLGVQETIGKTPSTTYVRMLADILNRKYYYKTDKKQKSPPETKPTSSPKNKGKPSFGSGMQEHNFDYTVIEQLNRLDMMHKSGIISSEQYKEEVEKFNIK